jgi:hypothetical protein
MIDRLTGFLEQTVSGDIDVSICYDGVLLVDGTEVCNIFEVVKKINDALLDKIDNLNSQ